MNEFDRNPGIVPTVPPVDPPSDPAKPVPMHHGMVVRLRNYFLTGLVLVGPAYITISLTWWFINWVDDLVRPFIPLAYRPPSEMPDVGPLPALQSGCVTFGYFGRTVRIKLNVAGVLRSELSRKSWKKETIVIGAATDAMEQVRGASAEVTRTIRALGEVLVAGLVAARLGSDRSTHLQRGERGVGCD